jgi:hypothetical protein
VNCGLVAAVSRQKNRISGSSDICQADADLKYRRKVLSVNRFDRNPRPKTSWEEKGEVGKKGVTAF